MSVSSTERQTQKSQPSSQERASSRDTSPTGRSEQLGLRGLDYAAQVARLAPDGAGAGAPVQMRGGAGADNQAVQAAAQHGTGGGGGQLPHLARIQESFGRHDVGQVQAYTGGRAKEATGAMGAEAYAVGDKVAFGGAPTLRTAAHEAAHVVQQRAGVQLSGGVGKAGDRYERNADAVADKVVAGQSAEGLLSTVAGTGGGGAVAGKNVQHYKQYPAKGEDDGKGSKSWVSNGAALRVTEDGTAAVEQPSMFGSDQLYVESGRVPGMNAELGKNKVPLKFTTAGGTVKGAPPVGGGGVKTLSKLKPVQVADPKKDASIPDDCGQAAHTVTGAKASGKTLKAEYKDKKGGEAHAKKSHPEMMKLEILAKHFDKELPNAATLIAEAEKALYASVRLSKLLRPYQGEIKWRVKAVNAAVEAINAARKSKDSKAEQAGFKKYKAARAEYDKYMLTKESTTGRTLADISKEQAKEHAEKMKRINAIFAPYNKLSGPEQEAFDKKAGINRHANPEVGQAYTVSSGGAPKSKMTWNYHWGGVILKSTTGSDNVTMEGYAGSVGEIYYQVYGVPSAKDARKGQTFHEQTRDDHQQHGDAPTTMATDKQ